MKKLALILALMLIPCSAFGLEMLTDNAMDEITGQDGVSIVADDIQLFLNVERFAYVDCDGFNTTAAFVFAGCSGDGAMFYVNNFQMDTININAVISTAGTGESAGTGVTESNGSVTWSHVPLMSTSCGIQLFYDYTDTTPYGTCISANVATALGLGTSTLGLDNLHTDPTNVYAGGVGRFLPQAIMIDITDRLPASSEGFAYIGDDTNIKIAGVMIGLPTAEIYIDEINLDMGIYDLDTVGDTGGVLNNGKSFGKFIIQGVTFTILDGWLEIAPH